MRNREVLDFRFSRNRVASIVSIIIPSAMAQRKSFFDDVKKELECSVCQELFSEVNEPKILKCLHTFCKDCLEAWLSRQREGQLSCPTCRQITECPSSNINCLPSNLFYKQMVEIVEANSGTAHEDDSLHCGNCEEKTPLKFYCFACNTFLCEKCAGAHSKWKLFKGHHVKEIGNFESSDVQDYARKSNVCEKHEDELRFYCENCNICICRDCAILEHRDDKNHNIVSLEQGFENKKSDITSKMKDNWQAIASRLRDQKQTLEKKKVGMLRSIDQATSEIHGVAEQWISFIRQNEAAMTKTLLEQKNSFQGTFSSQMSRLDEKLFEIDSSLVFSSDVLARENLPEILNVEEILGQRFQELSSEFRVNLNYSCIKYVPNDTSPSMKDVLGKLIFTKTDPMLTTANGKGLTEGTEDQVCSFKIETRNSQGQITYSGVDKVGVDIRSVDTGKVIVPEITDSNNGCYTVIFREL